MTDLELVERFWQLSRPDAKRMGPNGYRSWMRKHSPRLYKILLDGLCANGENAPELAALVEASLAE